MCEYISHVSVTTALSMTTLGILTLPFAFAQAGIGLSCIIIMMISLFTVIGIRVTSLGIEVLHIASHDELAARLLCGGRGGTCYYRGVSMGSIGGCMERLVSSSFFLYVIRLIMLSVNFGTAVVCTVVVRDMIGHLQIVIMMYYTSNVTTIAHTSEVLYHLLTSPYIMVFLFWAIVMLPLSQMKRMPYITFFSAVVIFVFLYIISSVIFRFFVPYTGRYNKSHHRIMVESSSTDGSIHHVGSDTHDTTTL